MVKSNKYNFIFISLLFLILIPSVAAFSLNDLLSRIQSLVTGLPYYEQSLTFISLLILFLAVFRVGSQKMASSLGWGNESANANKAISITLSFIATVSSYVFLNSKGIYIFHPIFAKVFLIVLLGLVVYRVVSIVRTEGEIGRLGKIFIAFAVIAGYEILQQWFFTDFPQVLGETLSGIIQIIYVIAIGYFGWGIFNLLSNDR